MDNMANKIFRVIRKDMNRDIETSKSPNLFGVIAFCGAFALFASVANAKDDQEVQNPNDLGGFIFVGPAIAPDFEGSEDYEAVPGLVGYVERDGQSALLTGTDLDIDILRSPKFNFGPSVSYRFERSDVENDQVDRLDDVDGAFELGANFAINFPTVISEGDVLSLGLRVTQDVSSAHDGYMARASLNYSYPVSERFNIMTGIELTSVSDDYAESYFGVSAAESARSGLSAYDADGGLKDVKLTLLANYALSEQWGIGGYVSYGQLLGDFADSSIVEEAGSENQFFGMLGVQYRF